MAVHSIPYTRFKIDSSPAFANGRVASRPLLRIKLAHGAQVLSCYAIVDSGADQCVFPRSFMASLGIDPLAAPLESMIGVSGTATPTHFANVSLELGSARVPIYAGFVTGLDAIGIGLLGQAGFFDRFNIHFRLRNGVFDVYAGLPQREVLKTTLIDFDLQALAFVADRRERENLGRQMSLLNENLIYLALGSFILLVGLIDLYQVIPAALRTFDMTKLRDVAASKAIPASAQSAPFCVPFFFRAEARLSAARGCRRRGTARNRKCAAPGRRPGNTTRRRW